VFYSHTYLINLVLEAVMSLKIKYTESGTKSNGKRVNNLQFADDFDFLTIIRSGSELHEIKNILTKPVKIQHNDQGRENQNKPKQTKTVVIEKAKEKQTGHNIHEVIAS